MITFDSQVNYFCDNLEIVNKILQLIESSPYYDEYIITADHNAVYLLKYQIQYPACSDPPRR